MHDFQKSRELRLLLNRAKQLHEENVRVIKSTCGRYPSRPLSERIRDIGITVDDMLDELERREDSVLVPGRFALEELRTRLREWVPGDGCPIGESLEREFWSLTSWFKHRTLNKLREEVTCTRGIQETSRKLESLEVLSKQRALSEDELRGVRTLKELLAHYNECLRMSQED